MANPQDDQDAARRRETASRYSAILSSAGLPVTIRDLTIRATPKEEAALAAGVMPQAIQAQLDRQLADDVAIEEMEASERDRDLTPTASEAEPDL